MKNTSQKKATDDQIIESYNRLKNVWLVAKEFDMCGQTVHERTVKLGIQKKMNKFTEEDDFFLKENYNEYLYKGKLQELADKMGRTKQFICRQAKRLGLTDINRKKSLIEGYKPHSPKWTEKSHPKGMLGKKHTKETLDVLSKISKDRYENMSDQQKSDKVFKMMKTKEKNGTMVSERQKTTWKSGWREIGGKRKYFRSRWEANYARYLEFLKQSNQILEWVHEPEVFWFEGIKRGCVSYLPDFKVTYIDNVIEYHEVKGWMDDRSKTKIKRMAKYHPTVVLKIIDAKWFKANNKTLTQIIYGWEV
jgi:hypothetical protein